MQGSSIFDVAAKLHQTALIEVASHKHYQS